MNFNDHSIEISCSQKNICDIANVLVQSIAFYRTYGKFTFNRESNYSIGSLGVERVECKQINFTYVRCSDECLANKIESRIQEFVSKLSDQSTYATLRLEFYTRIPNRWPFNETKVVWESWNLRFSLAQPSSGPSSPASASASSPSSKLGGTPNGSPARNSMNDIETVLANKLMDVMILVNQDRGVLPPMPSQSSLDTVFDTNLNDIQSYLFSISWRINDSVEKQGTAIVDRFLDSSSSSGDSPRRSSIQKLILDALEL